jgi:putative holliday junction resolvase
MRILAIDTGSVRVGLALSDELGMLAHPLEVLPAEPLSTLIQRLQEIVTEKKVELVLVGLPRNMDGSYGPAAEKVLELVQKLRAQLPIPIKTWDERLTSVQAHRFLDETEISQKNRREKTDKVAAAVLLQSYLDSLP